MHLILLVYISFLIFAIAPARGLSGKIYTAELVAVNITNNLDVLEKDIAVMFYAPWCRYCKYVLLYKFSVTFKGNLINYYSKQDNWLHRLSKWRCYVRVIKI